MDGERHIFSVQTERSEEKRCRGGEWCMQRGQQRRVVLFLVPTTAKESHSVQQKDLEPVVLNYQNLDGNDDYLFRFIDLEGHKSLANQALGFLNPTIHMI